MTESTTQNQTPDVAVIRSETPMREKQSHTQQPVFYVRPAVDVIEDETGITVIAELPGVANEQVKVEIDGETLTIGAPVDSALSGGREARFKRSFTLSRELDPEAIEAALTQGLLNLRIGKRAEVKPRKIDVRAA